MILLLAYLAYAMILLIALSRRGVICSVPIPVEAAPAVSRILIVGATGGTGRALVAQALDRDFNVTALVRNPARLDIVHPRLTVIRGDVMDAAVVNVAVRGQDAVVCVLGHKRFFYPTRILSEGTRNLLRAMEANGVRRLVCQTSLGIGSSAGRMGVYYTLFVVPVILPFYFWDKTRQERLISASRTEWVVVRPAALSNGAPLGTCRHGGEVGGFVLTPGVARADVARFMLDQLSGNDHLGSAVGVSS
ncbi:MAG: SDR family oxidoreductase [Acidobacteria bacterium]|nr:SDR family oxidoreductase [Acidobacteriota bacterium]